MVSWLLWNILQEYCELNSHMVTPVVTSIDLETKTPFTFSPAFIWYKISEIPLKYFPTTSRRSLDRKCDGDAMRSGSYFEINELSIAPLHKYLSCSKSRPIVLTLSDKQCTLRNLTTQYMRLNRTKLLFLFLAFGGVQLLQGIMPQLKFEGLSVLCLCTDPATGRGPTRCLCSGRFAALQLYANVNTGAPISGGDWERGRWFWLVVAVTTRARPVKQRLHQTRLLDCHSVRGQTYTRQVFTSYEEHVQVFKRQP